ncbi:hypothetical protein [Microvirga alba]|uniref:Uncharacterized protein n=1 Tax=Microvirga alba TaxID=2791025 RepID=A0A931BJW3_9HYPH|nr:hypothetical protein [Microvirga alba]MBF9232317.1 hypothetical protein [Microvirga alba]
MYEIYHIESLGPEADGGRIIRRILVRTDAVEVAKERAMKVMQKARLPQATGPEVEVVRVRNGAGHEVFSVSVRD